MVSPLAKQLQSIEADSSRLQQWREKTHYRFPQALGERTFSAYHTLGDEVALLDVVHENLFETQSGFTVVDEGVRLEIVLKTAEVHVGRTAGTHYIIANEKLGMKKSRTVEVYLYASLDGLEDIRPARPARAAIRIADITVSVGRKYGVSIYT